MRRTILSAAVAVATVLFCCEPPAHPKHEGAEDELCNAACGREAQCDASVDRKTCVTACKNHLSPRVVYYNDAYLTGLRACSERQACNGNVAASIAACERDVKARLTPSAAAQSYCARAREKDRSCGNGMGDTEHCLFAMKRYSDAILSQLSDCLDDPCRHAGRCTYAVLGADALEDDRDRQADFKKQAIEKPRETVGFSGKVVVVDENDAPIAGTKVCIAGEPSVPCTVTDDAGRFAMEIPAAKDLAVTVDAPKPEFAPLAFGLSAKSSDATGWTVGVSRAAALVKRYAKYGATYPADAVGFLRVTINTPKKSDVDVSGANANIAPPSGHGPFFTAAKADADGGVKTLRTKAIYFSDLAPGTVEVTIEPSSLSCTPAFGAWSSGRPNTVRVPIVAGYETAVHQRCGLDREN